MYEANGRNCKTYKNALAYAKRNAQKEKYSFPELIEDAAIEYYLTDEEKEMLQQDIRQYCNKNYLYF